MIIKYILIMRYKLLGKSGLRVSELCLGTMTFGNEWGNMLKGSPKEEAKKIFDSYIDSGGNFIDTANIYQNGMSEKFLGEFMSGNREQIVLSTKYSLSTNPSDPNASGNHRKNLMFSVNASLERLKTNYIDLLWIHAWDLVTPINEIMRSLDDLIQDNKILYIGISNAPAWMITIANTLAESKGWSKFISVQILYNLIDRTAERDLIPMANFSDIGITAWSPLASGFLSGKYSNKQNSKSGENKRLNRDNPYTNLLLNKRNYAIVNVVKEIAREVNVTPSEIALNWLLQQNKGNIIPIIGAKTTTQLKNNINCLNFKLKKEHIQKLSGISDIELGFPHDFLSYEFMRDFLYGSNFYTDNYR